MKAHCITNRNSSQKSVRAVLCGALTLASLLAASTLPAADFTFSGESATLLRLGENYDGGKNSQLYEYLRLNMGTTLLDGAALDFQLGSWGRGDLGDRSFDKRFDGDLQYAVLTYRPVKNNASVSLGRQYVTEGVASEHLDGLYLRSDLMAGFSASAYAGASVTQETDNDAGSTLYGARLARTDGKYYTAGLSLLKSENNGYNRYREEYGLDLWLRPGFNVDITGRSTYNGITDGFMEHAYSASAQASKTVRVSLDLAAINYNDYFYNMTSNVFRLYAGPGGALDANEEMKSLGTVVTVTPLKGLDVSGTYRHYDYKHAGSADYFGGKAIYMPAETLTLGANLHRMEGESDDRLKFTESGAFISKRFGATLLTANCHNVWYDREQNGRNNSLTLTGTAGYDLTPKLHIGADIEFGRNPYFDNETRALLKAVYQFDGKFTNQGGKSEK